MLKNILKKNSAICKKNFTLGISRAIERADYYYNREN